MVEKLLQHKHCINCGLAVKSEMEYCSDECKEGHKQMLNKKRKQLLAIYIGSVILVIILVLLSMGGR